MHVGSSASMQAHSICKLFTTVDVHNAVVEIHLFLFQFSATLERYFTYFQLLFCSISQEVMALVADCH